MSVLPITALWAGPTPTAYPARQTIVIGTPGASGSAGPNLISTATAITLPTNNLVASGSTGFVFPVTVGTGLVLNVNFPPTAYELVNDDPGSVAVNNLLNASATFSGDLQFTGAVTFTGDILCGAIDTQGENITAGAFIGDGSQLTNLPGGMAIGGTVSGGTAGRVLLVGTGPVLDDDPSLLFDTTNGILKVLQPGGVAGTDELRMYHDGNSGYIENRESGGAGHIYIMCRDQSTYIGVKRSVGLEVGPTGSPGYLLGEPHFRIGSNRQIGWSSTTNVNSANNDTALERAAAKVIGLTDGSTAGATLRSVPLSPATITADVNNYSLAVGRFNRLATDASRTLTGLVAGVTGEEREIWNVGSNNLVLAHQSASSTDVNRFICTGAANITLAPDEQALLRYDGVTQRWRARKI